MGNHTKIYAWEELRREVISVGGVYFYVPLLKLVVCCCKIACNLVRKAYFTVAHIVTVGQQTV